MLLGALVFASPLNGQEPRLMRGRVVDAVTRAPVAGASVSVVGGGEQSLTGTAGEFLLAGSGGTRLRVRRLGYVSREVPAPAGTAITIELEPLAVALDAMVVTAARREQRLADAVPATELIGRREIDESGASDVGGVLTQATGIQLEGGVPGGAGVYLQGHDSRRVLILLDGQPLVGRLNGNFDLSRIPISAVDRIEVVRGPQSTLYGSDAMGGVVNIITRAPAEAFDASLTMRGGSQGRRELSANARGTLGRMGLALDAGGRGEDLAPGRPEDDATLARRWTVAPKARWALTEASHLEMSGLFVGEAQRYRAGQLFHFADNTQAAARASWVWQRGPRRFAPTLSWSRFGHLSRAATTGSPVSDSGARDVQSLAQLDIAGSFPVAAGGVADVGAVLRRDAIDADRVSGGARASHALESYAEGTWTRGAWSVTPGIRVTSHEQWGSALTPRLALLVRPAAGLAVRASAGTAYRTPDFKELYYDFANPAAGYAVRGNPGLRPERSATVALGVEAVAGRWFARAGAFRGSFRDLIDYGPPDVTGTYSLGNVARGTTAGVDLEAGWSRRRLRVEGGYAWLDARDHRGTPLPGRAPHGARVRASAGAGPAAAMAALFLSGRTPAQTDSAGRVTGVRPAFARVDVQGSLRPRRGVELTAAVENLFDRRLEGAWPGHTGRRFAAGLTWTPSDR